jgi:hypothetical protein
VIVLIHKLKRLFYDVCSRSKRRLKRTSPAREYFAAPNVVSGVSPQPDLVSRLVRGWKSLKDNANTADEYFVARGQI